MSKNGSFPPTHWPYPALAAHRGAGKLAPENTLAAFRLGRSYGYCMFECDVKLSADGVAYLMHDPTLERCSNGQGAADDWTWLNLSQLDAGLWHSGMYAGEPVPSLATIAQFVQEQQCWLNIEIKPIPSTDAATGAGVAHAAAALWKGRAQQPLLSSFSELALQAAMLAQPHLPRALLVDAIPRDWPTQLAALGCVALICHHRTLDLSNTTQLAQIHAIRHAGFALAVYTCNEPARAQNLLAAGINTVITDAVDLIRP